MNFSAEECMAMYTVLLYLEQFMEQLARVTSYEYGTGTLTALNFSTILK